MSAFELIIAVSYAGSYGVLQSVSLLWNLRRIGTRWDVTKDSQKPFPSKQLPRASFLSSLQTQIIFACVAYLLLDLAASAPQPPAMLLQPSKQALWKGVSELSLPDAAFRFIGSVGFYVSTAILLSVVHSTVVAMGAVLNWWDFDSCVPLFGSVSEAYTVRKFWGSVWHQCLRRLLTGPADLISDSILRIPRGTLLSRYSRLLLAFTISGALHHAGDIAVGVRPQDAGGGRFFILQGLVIMLEDFVQHIVATNSSLARNSPARDQIFKRIGFVWVLCVMAWSTPTWFYPMQRLGIDPAALLPFRVIPRVGALIG
ncbi:membrane bound O-acyl transferase family-domain-containing protein [Apiospora kogelbergensis]|uniref:Membrane bound O-acyl transferase family-domain-containing protein n=1 Tax=Apiospora kogelbergensis TaxID=1337665 RepID=A0AAW0R7F0_9PEZI